MFLIYQNSLITTVKSLHVRLCSNKHDLSPLVWVRIRAGPSNGGHKSEIDLHLYIGNPQQLEFVCECVCVCCFIIVSTHSICGETEHPEITGPDGPSCGSGGLDKSRDGQHLLHKVPGEHLEEVLKA